jgi:hypothetical protein
MLTTYQEVTWCFTKPNHDIKYQAEPLQQQNNQPKMAAAANDRKQYSQ